MDMVERVSEAIMASAKSQTSGFDDYPASGLDYDALARAAIEAMREPTVDMKYVGSGIIRNSAAIGGFAELARAKDVWSAMIDAALTPSPTGR